MCRIIKEYFTNCPVICSQRFYYSVAYLLTFLFPQAEALAWSAGGAGLSGIFSQIDVVPFIIENF